MVIWADTTNESFWAGIVGHFQVDFTHELEEPKFEEKDEVFKVTLFVPGDDTLDLIPEREGFCPANYCLLNHPCLIIIKQVYFS